MKKLEEQKFTMQTMMQFDLNRVNYAVSHSRHITSKIGSAKNETTNQEKLAAEDSLRRRYEQKNSHDSIRVLRF